MESRSVLDTLDLCTALGVQTESPTSSQAIGWLSPRISFSTGFVDRLAVKEVEISESCVRDDQWSGEDRALDFEFCMATSSLDPAPGGCMLHADELFHKGKLLPQSLPPLFPRQEKLSVSFSAPLDTLKTPFVNVAMPSQRENSSCLSTSGRVPWEETAGLSFSGPLQRHENNHFRFSGPLVSQQRPSTAFSGPLSVESLPPCTPLPNSQGAGVRVPKSQTWEKVFGLLRRARSDSHRDRLCPEKDHVPIPKVPAPVPKISSSAANSLRLIFRRNSSVERTTKTGLSEVSQPPLKSDIPHLSSVELTTPSSPPSPATPHFTPTACVLDTPSLSVLHVASPVYPTGSASETDRDVDDDRWSSSATDVDLRPGSLRNSWRMSETENSLDITFDKFEKLNAAELKRKLDRGCPGTPPVTNSSRIVLKNLERCSNPPCKGGKGQDQLRALRTREIRRSPERPTSYSSSVRVTPVLNVPVCIGPALRSSKSAKGRLASLRSLLSFKKDKDEKSPSSFTTAAA